jgi:hypothetical protein
MDISASISCSTQSKTLRAKIHEIEDAEFQTIERKALAPNDAT